MMDMHRCIGCRYCIAACPYGARSFNWRDPREYIERDANGKFAVELPHPDQGGGGEVQLLCGAICATDVEPACVEAANGMPGGEGRLIFGDLSDPDSEVSQVLREKHTICRRVSLGTGPNVFYIV